MTTKRRINTTPNESTTFSLSRIEAGKYWAVEIRDESNFPVFKLESDRHGWTCSEKGGDIAGSGKTIKNALQSAVWGLLAR